MPNWKKLIVSGSDANLNSLNVTTSITGSDVKIDDWGSISGSLANLTDNTPDGSGTANYITKWSDSDTLSNSTIYDNAGTITIGSTQQGWSGNKLNIGSTSDGASGMNILTSTTGNAYIIFSDVVDGSTSEYANQIRYSHTDNFLAIQTEGTERLRIKSGGNVGIGTSDPALRLHVHGTARATNLLLGDSSTANTPTIPLFIKSSGTNARMRIEDSDGVNTSYDFLVNQGAGLSIIEGSTTRMYIEEGGNVGIGTTTPSSTLHVSSSTFNDHIKLGRDSDVLGITVSGGQILLEGGASPYVNDTMDLGRSDKHWRNLYINDNIYVSESAVLNLEGGLKVNGNHLEIRSDGADAHGAELFLRHSNNNTTDTIGTIWFGNNADNTLSSIVAETNGANNTSNLKFRTSNAGTIATGFTLSSTGFATFSSTIKSNTGVLALGSDVTLFRDGSNILRTDDAFHANNSIHVGGDGKVYDRANTSNYIELADTVNISTDTSVTGDLTVTGTITAQEFHTELVSASIVYESGSTKFGNTVDDNHDFTGSLNILAQSGASGIQLDRGTNTYININNSSTRNEFNFKSTAGLRFYHGTDSTSPLFISSSGNVGIGTTSPLSRLTVAGGTGTTFNDGTLQVVGSIAMVSTSNLNAALNRWVLRPRAAGVDGTFDVYDARHSLTRLAINNSGQVTLPAYGSGTHTGTVASTLGVDSSGNIIEFTGGGGGSVSAITNGADTRVAYFNGSDSLEGSANFTWDDTQLTVVGDVEANEFIGDLRGAVLFKAQAGEVLSKGDAVYISGVSGNTTVVSKADADDVNKMPAFGIASAAASLNNPVDIYTVGTLKGIDTSGFTIGDELYVSSSAGELTATSPTGESTLIQKIAKVTRVDNAAGSIKISGAGRTNATPNLNEGRLFVGNASNQSVADGTVHVDIANSRVGIGTTSPSVKLDVNGSVFINSNYPSNAAANDLTIGKTTTGDHGLTIVTSATNTAGIFFADNNNNDAGRIKYQHSNNSMRFDTNRSEAMRIDSSGNVGIGTTSPDNSLELFKEQDADYLGLKVTKLHSNTSEYTTEYGNNQINFSGNQAYYIYNGSNKVAFFHDGATKFYADGGVERMNISGSGEVIIGALSSGATGQLVVNQEGGVAPVAKFMTRTNKAIVQVSDNDTTGYISSENGLFSLGRNAGVNATNININASHNVGIGTSSPGAKLDVHGRVDFANDLRLRGTDSSADQGVVRFYVNSNNKLTIDTSNNGNNLFVIDEGGQVGINTSSPSRTLDVNGDIQNNGVLRRGGNVYIKSTGSDTSIGPAGAGTITFHTSSVLTGAAEAMRIDADGNLLLNNTSAGARLDIREDTNYAIRAEDASGHYFRVNTGGDVDMRGDLVVQGTITAQQFHSEFVSASIIYDSGSTKFGDTSDDNHDFTGSLNLKGQLTVDTSVPIKLLVNGGADNDSAEVRNGSGELKIYSGRTTAGLHQSIVFASGDNYTSGATRMIISGSNGNVGIGTTSPQEKLDISAGDIRLDNNFSINWATTDANIGRVRIAGNEANDFLQFATDNSERMRLTNTGLGIGTTNPQKKLDVYLGTDSAVASIGGTISAGEYAGLHFGYSETGNSLYRHSAIVFERDDSAFGDARGKIHILNSPSGSASADLGDARLTILPSGNVGIGTTSPTHKLTVTGDIDADDITIDDWGSVSASLASISDAGGVNGTGTATYLTKWVDSDTVTSSGMFQAASGNFSIGISTPNAKLSVVNDISIGTSATDVLRLHNESGVGTIDGYSTRSIAFGSATNGEVMRIDNTNGRVGIGTTTPSYKLTSYSTTAEGSATDEFPIVAGKANAIGNFTGIGLSGYIAGNGAVKAGIVLDRVGSYGTGNLHILNNNTTTNADATLSDSKVTILGNGNVGIGTTAPKQLFHVHGGSTAGSVTKAVIGGTGGNGESYLYLAEHFSGDNVNYGFSFVTDGNSSNNLLIKRHSNSTSGVTVLTINRDNSDASFSGALQVGSNLDVNGTSLTLSSAAITYQNNNDVDTGTETIATVVKANHDAAFFDYVVKNGTNLRAGTVIAVHDGTNVEFTDNSTKDIGDTSGVTFSVDISGTDLRLRATTTSDNWVIKTLVKSI